MPSSLLHPQYKLHYSSLDRTISYFCLLYIAQVLSSHKSHLQVLHLSERYHILIVFQLHKYHHLPPLKLLHQKPKIHIRINMRIQRCKITIFKNVMSEHIYMCIYSFVLYKMSSVCIYILGKMYSFTKKKCYQLLK